MQLERVVRYLTVPGGLVFETNTEGVSVVGKIEEKKFCPALTSGGLTYNFITRATTDNKSKNLVLSLCYREGPRSSVLSFPDRVKTNM